jgi:hypothetical protein
MGQGFTGNRIKEELRDILKQTTPPTNIFLLQESKLLEMASFKQARFIEFKRGSNLWNKGSFSASTTCFKGGI